MGVHRPLRDRGNGEDRGVTPTQTLPHPGGGFPNAIPPGRPAGGEREEKGEPRDFDMTGYRPRLTRQRFCSR